MLSGLMYYCPYISLFKVAFFNVVRENNRLVDHGDSNHVVDII